MAMCVGVCVVCMRVWMLVMMANEDEIGDGQRSVVIESRRVQLECRDCCPPGRRSVRDRAPEVGRRYMDRISVATPVAREANPAKLAQMLQRLQ